MQLYPNFEENEDEEEAIDRLTLTKKKGEKKRNRKNQFVIAGAMGIYRASCRWRGIVVLTCASLFCRKTNAFICRAQEDRMTGFTFSGNMISSMSIYNEHIAQIALFAPPARNGHDGFRCRIMVWGCGSICRSDKYSNVYTHYICSAAYIIRRHMDNNKGHVIP